MPAKLNGESDEAIERLRSAIEINPNYALAYHGLGYVHVLSAPGHLGRSDEAEQV